jgi:hypothetical protein
MYMFLMRCSVTMHKHGLMVTTQKLFGTEMLVCLAWPEHSCKLRRFSTELEWLDDILHYTGTLLWIPVFPGTGLLKCNGCKM